MNLNTSLLDYDREIFTGIRFTFENFEELMLDSKYVENLDIYTSDLQSNEYSLVMVIFSQLLKKEAKDVIEYLSERKDITYIDAIGIDQDDSIKTLISIRVPYCEDQSGDNKYQELGEFENGVIYLQFNRDLLCN